MYKSQLMFKILKILGNWGTRPRLVTSAYIWKAVKWFSKCDFSSFSQ